jgi:hypothetical protein
MSSLKISTPKPAVRPSTLEHVKGPEFRPAKPAAPKAPGAHVPDGFVPKRPLGKGVDRAGTSFEPARPGGSRAASGSGTKGISGKVSQALLDGIKMGAQDIGSRVDAADKKGQKQAIDELVKRLTDGMGLSKHAIKWITRQTNHAVKAYYSGSGSSANKTFGGE